MLEVIAVVVAAAALAICAGLAVRFRELSRRLRAAELALANSPSTGTALPEPPEPRPLEGLRVGVAITQDHPHAPFADLLKEHLFAEDVSDISILSPEAAKALRANWTSDDAPDILIAGEIACNGYAEVYYTADISCFTPQEAVCTVVERPPHGDRPVNLATGLISKLKQELDKIVGRDERRRAVRELRGL